MRRKEQRSAVIGPLGVTEHLLMRPMITVIDYQLMTTYRQICETLRAQDEIWTDSDGEDDYDFI